MYRYLRPIRTDAHIHLFRPTSVARARGESDLNRYEALRRAHNIDLALVVGYEGAARCAGNNAYLAHIAERVPWARPLAYIPPDQDGPERLASLSSPFCGVSLYLNEPTSAETAASWPEQAWSAVRRRRGVVSLNVPDSLLPWARTLASRAAPAPVLVSHIGLPGPTSVSADPRRVLAPLLESAEEPNLHVKLSGLYALGAGASDSGWLRRAAGAVVDAFGADRVHWGSDFPSVLSHQAFQVALANEILHAFRADVARQVRGDSLAALLKSVDRV